MDYFKKTASKSIYNILVDVRLGQYFKETEKNPPKLQGKLQVEYCIYSSLPATENIGLGPNLTGTAGKEKKKTAVYTKMQSQMLNIHAYETTMSFNLIQFALIVCLAVWKSLFLLSAGEKKHTSNTSLMVL